MREIEGIWKLRGIEGNDFPGRCECKRTNEQIYLFDSDKHKNNFK
jgi:hypothetical protein